MRSVIVLILICQLISSGYCFLFGIGEDPANVTTLKYHKSNSCGLKYGGSMVQLAATPYIAVDAINWYDIEQCLMFADRYNSTLCCYHEDVPRTANYYVEELENMEIAAVFGVKDRTDKYVIAANQSIFLLTSMPPENGKWKYTFKKLMDVTDDSRLLTKGIVDKRSHIILGTKPSSFSGQNVNALQGKGQLLYVDLENKNVSILEDNYSLINGMAIDYNGEYRYHADMYQNKIWRRKWAPDSQLELVFDMNQYEDTVFGQVSAITLDTDGKLWITLLNSYQVITFDVDTKRITRQISVAAPSVHSIGWGGLWYETLYVGTSTKRVNTRAVPAAGTLIGISGTGSKGWRHEKVKVANDWLN